MQEETKNILDEFGRYRAGTKNNSQNSVRTYMASLRMFFQFIKKHPSQVSLDDIEDYMIYLKVTRKNSVNTQKAKQVVLRLFYAWYSTKYHTENPTEKLILIQEEIKIPIMPTPDEFTRMVNSCDVSTEIGRRDAALICVLADTGIRLGECVALRVGNVEVHENNFILIVPRIKSRRERVVPFGRLIEGDIVAEYFSLFFNEIRFLKNSSMDDPLFKQIGLFTKDGPLGKAGIAYRIKKYTKAAGVLKKITPHSFRHFFGTYSVMKGADPYTLRQLMGHAWLDTTARYVHLSEFYKGTSVEHRGVAGQQAPESMRGFAKITRNALKQALFKQTNDRSMT